MADWTMAKPQQTSGTIDRAQLTADLNSMTAAYVAAHPVATTAGPAVAAVTQSSYGKTFVARFDADDECIHCGMDVERGQSVRYYYAGPGNRSLVHANCTASAGAHSAHVEEMRAYASPEISTAAAYNAD